MNSYIWTHFPDFHLFQKCFLQGHNIFLVGPPNTGKTTLVNQILTNQDFQKKKIRVVKVNCLMSSSLTKMKHSLLKKIMEGIDRNNKKKYLSFQ